MRIGVCLFIITLSVSFILPLTVNGEEVKEVKVEEEKKDNKEKTEKEKIQSFIKEWRTILLYGIDEEIIEVIKSIKSAKETSLNKELNQVLKESLSTDVRKDILDYFRQLKYKESEKYALKMLSHYGDEDKELVIALIKYLSDIGSLDSIELLKELADSDNINIAAIAIKALGETKKISIGAFLLKRLNDDEYEEKLKPEIILALGALKNNEAVDALIEIIEDKSEEKIWRMYAIDSLGKIGDKKAVPALKKIFSEKDAIIRAYAASALSEFIAGDEVVEILIQGLKDSNWKVRIASAEALGKGKGQGKAGKVLDILMYKAKKDPVNKVRLEAIKAIGEIGLKNGFKLLRELYSSDKQNLSVREVSLCVLVEKNLRDSIRTIKKVVEKELTKSLTKEKILEITGKKLFHVKSGSLKDIFKLFLGSSNIAIRVYGIRGIAFNRFGDLKDKLKTISENDPVSGVRKSALSALENW